MEHIPTVSMRGRRGFLGFVACAVLAMVGCRAKEAPTASGPVTASDRGLASPSAAGSPPSPGARAKDVAAPSAAAYPSKPSAPAAAAEGAGLGPSGAVAAKPALPSPRTARHETEPLALNQGAGRLTAGAWDDAKNFPFFTSFTRDLAQRGGDFDLFSATELSLARERSVARRKPKRALDIAFVFDTTGSMGDELRFVQSEVEHIAARIHDRFPGVTTRFALTAYKDHSDVYVTRSHPFTASVQEIRAALEAESAGGGGDYPEAVVEGLRAASQLGWRTDAEAARVAFWIADAPSHPGEGRSFAGAVRTIADRGIRLYPIAASGSDDLTEYEMRSAALMTGGRYLFITDDSGIGEAHAEPHIPCYAVTRLDHAINRMIAAEISGDPPPVGQDEVIRTVGAPDAAGACTSQKGQRFAAF